MRVTARKPVVKEVTIATECDACGKRHPGYAESWPHFMSGHGEWGNDSPESVEWWDACSPECYLAIAKRVLDVYDTPPPSLTIDDKSAKFMSALIAAAGRR